MKVFATTAISPSVASTYLPLFDRLAERDRFRVHTLVASPDDADIILFLDGHQHYEDLQLKAIRQHPLVSQYREKTFVYNELDQPWCALPGLYVSMPKRSFHWQRQRPCSYLCLINELVESTRDSAVQPDLLFSYMGRLGHSVRDKIMRLSHPRALLEDTTNLSFFGAATAEIHRQKLRYAQTIHRSKFVLCPRGSGPSSFRLFETLAAGRAPVIVSDEWMAPRGPDWPAFSLQVPERQVRRLPEILERNEDRAAAMAVAARAAWDEWFSPDVLFHRMIESCREIIEARSISENVMAGRFDLRYLRLRAREWKHQVKSAVSAAIDRVGRRPTPSQDPA